jgi:hypothetical protein
MFHKVTMWQLEDELIFDSVETAVDYVSKYWEAFADPVADECANVKVSGNLDNIFIKYDAINFDGDINVTTSYEEVFDIKPVTVIVE